MIPAAWTAYNGGAPGAAALIRCAGDHTRASYFSSTGHLEFRFHFEDYVIDPWIDWLIDYIEQAVQATTFKDGETIQLGWMINLIKQDGSELTFHEPDTAPTWYAKCFPARRE